MTDRFDDIKKLFTEADAAGLIAANSPMRWLISEVERLRAMPTAEIQSCAVYANASRHSGRVVDAKTVLVWLRESGLDGR